MTDKQNESRERLNRLSDSLAHDLDELTDKELILEVSEDYGDPEKLVTDTKELIQQAIKSPGQRRLAAARAAYNAISNKPKARIVDLPLDRKRQLLDKIVSNDGQFQEMLTMAARSRVGNEADIDCVIEDLIELGVIDEEGNLQ